MNQVVDDWKAKPYDDIIITNASSCPSDYPQAVFERVFYGLNFGCNCIGIWDSRISNDDKMYSDSFCSYNETRAGCTDVMPIWPIHQTQFKSKRICGSTKYATPFLNATRPNF
jgi:hypothetical protein